MTARYTGTLVLGLCIGLPVAARASDQEASPIVVTATRTPQTADSTLASVTVITRREIERSQAQDLVDLLRLEAGVDVGRAGGPGQQTSVFLRGTNSNHVLVLVDGVRVASTSTGAFAWENLDPSMIERIEIVRGPRAALYGSDAIGGVIQIFTRKPRGPVATIEGGSFDTQGVNVGTGGGSGRVSAYFDANYQRSDGFPATNPSAGPYYSPRDDGYSHEGVTAGLRARLSSRTTVDLNGWGSVHRNEFNDYGGLPAHSTGQNSAVSARLVNATTDHWTQVLTLGNSIDNLDTQSSFPTRVDSVRNQIDWQNDLALGARNSLTLGASYMQALGKTVDTSADSVLFDRSTYNRAVYANWQGHFGSQRLELGARHDDNSQFGGHSTGQVAWGWDATAAWRLMASYGTAFKAPDFAELYWPPYNNPNLAPETSRTTEIGLLHHPSADRRWRISLFDTRVANLIEYQGVNFTPINVDRASIRGAEITFLQRAAPWTFHADATLQRAIDDTTGTDLLRRPRQKLALRVDRDLGSRANVEAQWLLSSSRPDISNITGATINLPGYSLVNLAAGYALDRDWSLGGRVDNIFNKHYELVSGYNATPRAVYVTLRYAPRGRPAP